MRSILRVLSVAVTIALAVGGSAFAQERVSVFAAASLKNALDEIAAQWKQEAGQETSISYAASSALAKQIEQGAPADLFISADLDWMDYLSQKGLTKKETETRLLGNRIVLIAPADSSAAVEVKPGFDLAGALAGGKLAMANVDAVPAGKYGKAALEHLGAWDAVQGQVAQAENVRAALALVATGEAALGIVYQTDAAAEPKVKVLGTFPEDSHPPIVYPAAITASSTSPQAGEFFKFLMSDTARSAFEGQGFTVLTPPASN